MSMQASVITYGTGVLLTRESAEIPQKYWTDLYTKSPKS